MHSTIIWTFSYPGTEKKVLDHFNFKIRKGEKIGIAGASGAGKSTILRLLLRFYAPAEGEIRINGIPLEQISFAELHQRIAFLEHRLVGTVTSVTFKGVHYDTIVDFKGYKWLIQTTDYHEVGEVIGIILNPDDIHIMKKSEYSGQFGDYSSYSAEYDEINDPDFAEEDEEDADDED